MNSTGDELIKFTHFSDYQPGLLFDMFIQSYRICPELVNVGKESWREFDEFVYSNLEKFDKCGFVSCLQDKPIGFASWDPRNHPHFVLIGHNCILPEHQNQGFGRLQVLEMLKRFKNLKFKRVKVSTGSTTFFLPAQKMYESCGFREVERTLHKTIPDFTLVYYEKDIL